MWSKTIWWIISLDVCLHALSFLRGEQSSESTRCSRKTVSFEENATLATWNKQLILFCFTFVIKEWAKLRKKSHISSKLYGLLFAIFSATRLEFLSWNLRNRRILQKDCWTEVIEFHENFAWFRANTCDVVCKENLKHFHTSLLGNEEDAKGLLNIKQEFLSQ